MTLNLLNVDFRPAGSERGEELNDAQEKHQYFITVEESFTLVTYVCSLCGKSFLRLFKAHQKIRARSHENTYKSHHCGCVMHIFG